MSESIIITLTLSVMAHWKQRLLFFKMYTPPGRNMKTALSLSANMLSIYAKLTVWLHIVCRHLTENSVKMSKYSSHYINVFPFGLCRTLPVNSILPVWGRTPCGAPPRCAAWRHPPPPGACRPTWSSPTVPHTFPAVSTAHQVSTLNPIIRSNEPNLRGCVHDAFNWAALWNVLFLWSLGPEQEGKERLPPALRPPLPHLPPCQTTSP